MATVDQDILDKAMVHKDKVGMVYVCSAVYVMMVGEGKVDKGNFDKAEVDMAMVGKTIVDKTNKTKVGNSNLFKILFK